RVLRPHLGQVTRLASITLAVAWLVFAAAFWAVWPWLPIAADLVGVQRLVAAALAATLLISASPAVVVAVVTESRARGPLADLSIQVVLLMELATIALFMCLLEGARVAFEVAAPDRESTRLHSSHVKL